MGTLQLLNSLTEIRAQHYFPLFPTNHVMSPRITNQRNTMTNVEKSFLNLSPEHLCECEYTQIPHGKEPTRSLQNANSLDRILSNRRHLLPSSGALQTQPNYDHLYPAANVVAPGQPPNPTSSNLPSSSVEEKKPETIIIRSGRQSRLHVRIADYDMKWTTNCLFTNLDLSRQLTYTILEKGDVTRVILF